MKTNTHKIGPIFVTMLTALFLTGCGGGSSDSDSASDIVEKEVAGCDSCHNQTEFGGEPVPQIEGMNSDYFVHLMRAIAIGSRLARTPAMESESKRLFEEYTEEEIKTLADYYSSQHLQLKTQENVDAVKAEAGEALHNANCNDCHNNGGRDINNGILAGQRLEFLKLALEDFADDDIKTEDVPHSMVRRLQDLPLENIGREAIAHYYASLGAEGDTEPPTPVTNLTIQQQSSTSITLDWDKATDNWDIRHYIISRNGVEIALAPISKFTDENLDTGQLTYRYSITSVDSSGNFAATSGNIDVAHDGGGSSTTGAGLYAADCASCHGEDPANGDNNIENGITADVIQNAEPASIHEGISVDDAELIANYIAGILGDDPAPPPPPPVDPPLAGKALYETQCAICHGDDPAQNLLNIVNGITLSGIRMEHNEAFVSNNDSELIAVYIADIISDGDGNLPPVANTAGKAIYDAQCILCHGSNPANGLRNINRGTDPSLITAEHSFVTQDDANTVALYINEIINPDPGDDPSDSDTPLTGQELYTLHCVSCHGANPVDGLLNVDLATTALSITNKHPGLISQDAQTENSQAQLISDYIVVVLNGNGGGSGNSNGGNSEIGGNSATIVVIQDVTINGNEEVNPQGNNEIFVDIISNGSDHRGLLFWDLTDPALQGKTITAVSITLNITNTSDGLDSNGNLKTFQFTKARTEAVWNENEVSFSDAFKDQAQLAEFVPDSLGTMVINLNSSGVSLVQSWLDDSATNQGVVVSSQGTSDSLEFSSHESGNGAILTLQYGNSVDPDIAAGKILYGADCAGCHNFNPGPNNNRRHIDRGVNASKITAFHNANNFYVADVEDAAIIAVYLQSVFP